MRHYQLGDYTKMDLKICLDWITKYRERILTGQIAIRTRDILRQIAVENEIDIITGKVSNDHVHMFVSYRPNQDISKIVHWLKDIRSRLLLSEFTRLKKQFWGHQFWARSYLAVSSDNNMDEMVYQHIQDQEGESIVDQQFIYNQPPHKTP